MEQHSGASRAQEPKIRVLDISVLLKRFFVDEDHHDKARVLISEHLREESIIVIPALAVYEFASVVQQRYPDFSLELIQDVIQQLYRFNLHIANLRHLQVMRAVELAGHTGASVYECIYAVIASREFDCEMITADMESYNKLSRFNGLSGIPKIKIRYLNGTNQ